MAIQLWRFLPTHERENSCCYFDLGINNHLNQFAQINFAFKSSCTHTLNLLIFLTHSCLFKSLSEDTFLILVSFSKLFKFSLLFILCVFLPSPFFLTLFSFSELFLGMGRFKRLVESKEGIEG